MSAGRLRSDCRINSRSLQPRHPAQVLSEQPGMPDAIGFPSKAGIVCLSNLLRRRDDPVCSVPITAEDAAGEELSYAIVRQLLACSASCRAARG